MLRQDPSNNIESDQNENSAPIRSGDADINHELNRLEEMILTSPHIPLSRRTIIDEEQLLDQLDSVRMRLPTVLQEAATIVEQKKAILLQAEEYAQEIIQAAEARAAQILNELDIMRQAELEAKQLQQQVQLECEAAQEETKVEIQRMRRQAQQELEEMRLQAIAEREDIQKGADAYADGVLKNIEQQLNEMLKVTRNGRQQLRLEPSQENNPLEPSSSKKPDQQRKSSGQGAQ